MRLRALACACILTVLFGAGCAEQQKPESTPTASSPSPNKSTPATSSPSASGCSDVASAFLSKVGASSASAFEESVPKKPTGLARNGKVWFVSTPNGATWVTNINPTGGDAAGLVLPLNSSARQASETGVDVPAGAPIYEGFTDSSPAAAASRACAKK
jgi:hypothetical protein